MNHASKNKFANDELVTQTLHQRVSIGSPSIRSDYWNCQGGRHLRGFRDGLAG